MTDSKLNFPHSKETKRFRALDEISLTQTLARDVKDLEMTEFKPSLQVPPPATRKLADFFQFPHRLLSGIRTAETGEIFFGFPLFALVLPLVAILPTVGCKDVSLEILFALKICRDGQECPKTSETGRSS